MSTIMSHRTRHRRAALATAILAPALLIGALWPHAAQAALGGCRTDPIVTLSNGARIHMSVAIDAASAAVQQIRYTLRAPAGTRVVQITYTGGALASKETVQVVADNPSGTYDTNTVVATSMPGVAVAATTHLAGLDSAWGTASGHDHQNLRVQITV